MSENEHMVESTSPDERDKQDERVGTPVLANAYTEYRSKCAKRKALDSLWDDVESTAYQNIVVRAATERATVYRLMLVGAQLARDKIGHISE